MPGLGPAPSPEIVHQRERGSAHARARPRPLDSERGECCPGRAVTAPLSGLPAPCVRVMMPGARGRPPPPVALSPELLAMGKGESLPPPTLQPGPTYPSLEFKAIPLHVGEEAEYMLALKQELRGAMKGLPYYVKPAAPKKDIERYSDKYQSSGPTDNTIEWNPDWRRLPRELKIRIRKPAKDKTPVPGRKLKPRTSVEKEEIIKKLETLEKKEEAHSSDEEEEQDKGEEEKENEEEYDEEEFEEETDYVMSYFDNGEEFGGDSDENMDEAIY